VKAGTGEMLYGFALRTLINLPSGLSFPEKYQSPSYQLGLLDSVLDAACEASSG